MLDKIKMWSRFRNFITRHKRKFIIGGVLIGGTVLLTKYIERKLKEWQEKEAREFMDRTRRQQHFESTERTCNQTIFSLTPTLIESIVKTLDTDDLIEKLRNNPIDRLSLWEELKIRAFTRAASYAYSAPMLVIALRIQLNLIGGYMYQDSSDGTSHHIDGALQQQYLSLCHHFLSNGVGKLCSLVENKVHLVVEGTSLKQRLRLQDTEQIFWAIQAAVASDPEDPIRKFSHYFLPEEIPSSSSEYEALMQKMIMETVDLLESEEVISLLSSCVSRSFSVLVDNVADSYAPVNDTTKGLLNAPDNGEPVAGPSGLQTQKDKGSGYSNGISNFTHPNNIAMPMAKLIPIVNKLTQGRGDAPDPLINQMIINEKVKMLGANVYEAFSHKL